MKKYLALVIGIIAVSWLVADQKDQFVIKRLPDKKLSVTALREKCSEGLSQALMMTPEMLKNIAEMQELSMAILQEELENNFFSAFSKEGITASAKDIKALLERQELINSLLSQQIQSLRKLKEG